MRYGLSAGIVFVFMIVLSSVLSFSTFTVHAQTATPARVGEEATRVPPTPTPIVIVITESVSVGEKSGNGGRDPITEDIAIEDSTSIIDSITEDIAIEDSTSTIDPITETIKIEATVYGPSAPGCLPLRDGNNLPPANADRAPAPESGRMPSPDAAREWASAEGCVPPADESGMPAPQSGRVPPSDMAAESQRPPEGGAFSRGMGSVKEGGEGAGDGSPSKAGNAGSIWMVVIYVVVGLGAAAALGLFGRRLVRTRSTS